MGGGGGGVILSALGGSWDLITEVLSTLTRNILTYKYSCLMCNPGY